MNYIEVKNVSKTFQKEKVLDDVSFSVRKGQFVSIVGPFGSGKSTILRILAGLESPGAGNVLIGEENAKEGRKEQIGFVFQRPNLLPWRNVFSNLSLALEIAETENKNKVSSFLKFMELDQIAQKELKELSGGMRQLVSIARSLILEPEILLLDEPFSSIDEITREKIREKVLSFQKKNNTTCVMVTHVIEDAILMSDSIIIFSNKPTKIKKVVKIKQEKSKIKPSLNLRLKYYSELIKKEMANECVS